MIFACMPVFGGDEREAILLAQSIRQFGERYADAQIVIMAPQTAPLSPGMYKKLAGLGARILPFELPDSALSFPYAQKVFAAAAAERNAGKERLVWMDSDTLILQPPVEFELPEGINIACCPVQLKNISSIANEPVNRFWQAIYNGCNTPPTRIFHLTTTTDHVEIRAQINAGLLVVRSQMGLLQAWQRNFERLYLAPELQSFYTDDRRYHIFVHQAVLSATLQAMYDTKAVLFLPPGYNVPVFLRERFSLDIQQPVTCRYDEFSWFENSSWSSGDAVTDAKIKDLLSIISK